MIKLSDLRNGDKILVEGIVVRVQVEAESIICELPSGNQIPIRHDKDLHQVTKFALKVGDRVKWHEDGEWQRGTILGLEVDQEPSANGRAWAWVKDDIKWPRRTFDTKELQRA